MIGRVCCLSAMVRDLCLSLFEPTEHLREKERKEKARWVVGVFDSFLIEPMLARNAGKLKVSLENEGF